MRSLKYKVEFFSDWHCGSGLGAGAELDASVLKDKNKLPYIPGKTMKGLIREAVEDVLFFKGNLDENSDLLIQMFGNSEDMDNRANKDKAAMQKACSFFTNATLDRKEASAIISGELKDYLYRSISSTAIDENGIAREHSLRKIEVTVPCTLYGEILDIPESLYDIVVSSLGMIKRLGMNRNRGLGRCKISIID